MSPLDPKDFPDFKESTIYSINALTNDQLRVEIEKKANSRFGAKKQPLLHAAFWHRTNKDLISQSEINPEPPVFLKNILWVVKYGCKYWYLMLIASLVLILPYAYQYFSSSNEHAESTSHPTQETKSSEHNQEEKTVLSAPNIRFSDGSVGIVELSVQARLDPDKLVAAHSLYGSAEAATNSLQTSLRSITINILETKTKKFVHLNREQLANEIIEKSIDAQNRTGYTIIEFSIGEIY